MTEHDEHAEHHHTLSYPDAIRQFRADKDAYFRTGHASPVPADDREAFAGIPYFPVDESFIAEGLTLEPYTGDDPCGSRSRRPTGVSGRRSGRACSTST